MKYFDEIAVVLISLFFLVGLCVARKVSASERKRQDEVRRFRNHVRSIGERDEIEGRR